jgi:hypothetical protein
MTRLDIQRREEAERILGHWTDEKKPSLAMEPDATSNYALEA